MCIVVVINKGEKEIQTPREFLKHFGINLIDDDSSTDMDCCLCDIDIEDVFNENGIEFELDWGDFYVND